MTEILPFPKPFRQHTKRTGKPGIFDQYLAALRMLYSDVMSGRTVPRKAFMLYEGAEGTWYYLNLGFEEDEVRIVLDNAELQAEAHAEELAFAKKMEQAQQGELDLDPPGS